MKNTKELHEYALSLLHERGVELEEIAKLVHFLQEPYFPNLTLEHCYNNVEFVLKKREVQNAIITGIELDKLAEKNQLSQPLNDILTKDEGLYGVDEILALSIVNVYGSIGSIKDWGLELQRNAIITNSKMETNLPGIFAVGDIATYEGKVQIIATGFGEAPIAVNQAMAYIHPEKRIQTIHSSSLF